MIQKSAYHKIRVGIFVVVGTIILLTTLYFIGDRQHIFNSNIRLCAIFQNVNGLQIGNNVRYSGINVGTVNKIEMLNNKEIIVQMTVEEKTGAFIKKDAVASIGTDGLVGSMVINIIPGNDSMQSVLSGDTITSYSKIGADDMLSTLNFTNENAAMLTSDLLKITRNILDGDGLLGTLLSNQMLTTLDSTNKNAALLTSDLIEITSNILEGDGLLTDLLSNSSLSKDIKETLYNLKLTSSETNTAVTQLNTLISKIDMEGSAAGVLLNDSLASKQIKNVFSQLEFSSSNIAEATKMLAEVVSELKENDNTINYLIKDEALPQTVDSIILEVNEASIKLNENLEALKHNFFFRRYFKKQERAANKKANIEN